MSPTLTTTPGGTVSISPITISGTKYLDTTGNGFCSTNTPQSGVTIYLYNSTTGLGTGSGYFEEATTTANGTFSFTNLSAGTYYVQEDVPSGYIQTGGGTSGSAGDTYYTVVATAGHSYSGYNFADYLIPTCQPTCVSYTDVHNGCSTTYSSLAGNTHPGDTVTVHFTTTMANETLTLASYSAPASSFIDSTAYEQLIYQDDTQTFATPGTYSLTVSIPNCYYQIDFICGPAISQFEPNYKNSAYGPDGGNITYHAEDRFIASDSGGTTAPTTLNTANPTVPLPTTAAAASTSLTDSATLSGGYSPTGTITFYLMPPGSTTSTPLSSAVYTNVVTVTGDGTYTTASGTNPGGYAATAAGTYQWVAVYASNNGNNAGTTSSFGSEPETVTSGTGVITGTKFLDTTGNGWCSANTPEAGVTIDLYNSTAGLGTGSGYYEQTTTASNGTYSFTGLAAGTYYVQEVVPSGYVQTGGGPNGTAGEHLLHHHGPERPNLFGQQFRRLPNPDLHPHQRLLHRLQRQLPVHQRELPGRKRPARGHGFRDVHHHHGERPGQPGELHRPGLVFQRCHGLRADDLRRCHRNLQPRDAYLVGLHPELLFPG